MSADKIYDLAYSYGKSLSVIDNIDQKVGDWIKENKICPQVEKLKSKISRQKSTFENKEDKIKNSFLKLEKLTEIKEDFKQLKKQEYNFSLFKGLFFVTVSILLLYSDIFLLGGVVRILFDLPAITVDQQNFGTLLLKSPIAALYAFPEIMTMSLTVLFMGFYIKVIEDTLIENSKKWSERNLKTKVFFIIELTTGILTIVILILIAIARYKTPISEKEVNETTMIIQLFSAFLGFALPYASAIFFMRGYYKLRNEYKFFRVKFKYTFWEILINKYKRQNNTVQNNITRINNQISELENETFNNLFNSSKLEFREGYNNAVDDLINTENKSLYESLKSIALKNTLTQNI